MGRGDSESVALLFDRRRRRQAVIELSPKRLAGQLDEERADELWRVVRGHLHGGELSAERRRDLEALLEYAYLRDVRSALIDTDGEREQIEAGLREDADWLIRRAADAAGELPQAVGTDGEQLARWIIGEALRSDREGAVCEHVTNTFSVVRLPGQRWDDLGERFRLIADELRRQAQRVVAGEGALGKPTSAMLTALTAACMARRLRQTEYLTQSLGLTSDIRPEADSEAAVRRLAAAPDARRALDDPFWEAAALDLESEELARRLCRPAADGDRPPFAHLRDLVFELCPDRRSRLTDAGIGGFVDQVRDPAQVQAAVRRMLRRLWPPDTPRRDALLVILEEELERRRKRSRA